MVFNQKSNVLTAAAVLNLEKIGFYKFEIAVTQLILSLES